MRMTRWLCAVARLSGVVLALVLATTSASAASISGPSTSTDGNFTLTWDSGYGLRLDDMDWDIAPIGATSYGFTNLPSSTYKFKLTYCVLNAQYQFVCTQQAGTTKTVTVTRDAEPAMTRRQRQPGRLRSARVCRVGARRISLCR